MLQLRMRNILLFSIVVIFAASCQQHDFSADEPLLPEKRSGVYVFGNNNFIYGIDPETGIKMWEQQLGFDIKWEPLVLDGLLFLSSPFGVIKIDGSSGRIVDTTFDLEFNIDTHKHYVIGPLAGQGDMVYGATADGYVAAFNYKTRDVAWQTPLPGPSSSASFFGSLLIFGAENKVFALNIADGNQVAWTFQANGDVNNPVLSPPFVYVTDASGTLTAIEIETGDVAWNHITGSPSVTSPIAFGKFIIYGADDNKLHCIDPDIVPGTQNPTRQAWEFNTDERVKGSAYGYNNTVYFGGVDHYFYAISTLTGAGGSLKWRYRTGGLIKSSPVAHNGTIYVASYDKHIYAFDTSGAMKWKFNVNGLIDGSPVVYDVNTNKAYYPAVSGMSTPQ